MPNTPVNQVNPELNAIEKQHRRETLVVNARPLLARVLLGLWIAIDAALVIFFISQIIWYVSSGTFVELRAIATLGNNVGVIHEAVNNRAAEDVVVNSAKILKSTDTSSDFFARIENPNEDWYATFTYTFTWGSGSTESLDGFVMPGEQKYLFALNQKSDIRPSTAELELSEFTWHWVDRHEVKDVATWMSEHQDFVVSEASHAADIELAEEKVGRSVFSLTNNTAYAYWEPVFSVVLERNGVPVAVNQATVQRFEAGETREVEMHWPGDAVVSGTPNVEPNINYFDASAYMTPGGVQADDWRDVLTSD